MKKKDQLPSKPAKTYLLGRACEYCAEPIADQERASKKHCTRWIDEAGKPHDCKRRKFTLKNRVEDEILLDFSAEQRETNRQIEKVIAAHGNEVSTEVLIAYNVQLGHNLRYEYYSGLLYAEFLGYRIISNPILNTHKIVKNDKL
jgi:hypothetical protein